MTYGPGRVSVILLVVLLHVRELQAMDPSREELQYTVHKEINSDGLVLWNWDVFDLNGFTLVSGTIQGYRHEAVQRALASITFAEAIHHSRRQ